MEVLDEDYRVSNPPYNEQDERTFAMLTHISSWAGLFVPLGSILGPLLVWALKRNESSFVDEHGKAALNFNLTYTIVSIILWSLWLVQFLGSLPLMIWMENKGNPDSALVLTAFFSSFLYFIPIILIYFVKFILSIVGAISASNGKPFSYPLTFRFIK